MEKETGENRLLLFFFSAVFLAAIQYNIFPGANKLSYSLVFVSIFVILYRLRVNNQKILFPFLLLIVHGLVISPFIEYPYSYLVRESLLYASYVLPLFCINFERIYAEDLDKVFFCLVIFYIFNSAVVFLQAGKVEYSFLDSYSAFEHAMYAPLLGLGSLHFFHRKKYSYSFLFFLLCLVALKRVVIIALLASLISKFFVRNGWGCKLSFVFLILMTFCFVYFINLLADGFFDEIMRESLGVSVNALTQGRQSLYQGILSYEIGGFAWLDKLFGNGAGFSAWFVENIAATSVPLHNIHSDILKIFYDHGYLVGVLFFITFFKHVVVSKYNVCLYVFITVCLVSDNFLVYAPVMFLFLTMVIINIRALRD